MKPGKRIKQQRGALSRQGTHGGWHQRGGAWAFADLHLDGLYIEELQGDVNGSNTLFYSTHQPDPGGHAGPLCILRGSTYFHGNHFTVAGRAWRLTEAPRTDIYYTDPAPIGIYVWNPLIPEGEYDPAFMGGLPPVHEPTPPIMLPPPVTLPPH